MADITHLSVEVITHLLSYKDISIRDVVNLSLTCKQLHAMINNDNNSLWRGKFSQKWPILQNICAKKWADANMRAEVIEKMKCKEELLNFITAMQNMHHYGMDPSTNNMKAFDPLFSVKKGASPFKYYYLEDELISIIEKPLKDQHTNWTHVYYAKKIIIYMKECRIRDKWHAFANLLPEQQLLTRVATLVAQWCQPWKRVSYLLVTKALDKLTKQVLQSLKSQYPEHPIFSAPAERLSFWRNNNIYKNQWETIPASQIVNVMCEVLFQQLNFRVLMEEEFLKYKLTTAVFFIDYVLQCRKGQLVPIAVIFKDVARRLGIYCELVMYPSHIYLSWRESDDDRKCSYIDFFTGSLLRSDNCPRHRPGRIFPDGMIIPTSFSVSSVQFVLRLGDCIAYGSDSIMRRSILKVKRLVQPENTDIILDLAQVYMLHNLDLTDIIPILKEALRRCNSATKYVRAEGIMLEGKVKRMLEKAEAYNALKQIRYHQSSQKLRTPFIKYAVGMIVGIIARHRRSIVQFGVIIGWDTQIDDNDLFIHKCTTLSNQNVRIGRSKQPLYRILVQTTVPFKRAEVCVLQDSLCPKILYSDIDPIIDHEEIGRYFSHFKETYYVPNEMLEKMYPDDAVVRENWILKLYG